MSNESSKWKSKHVHKDEYLTQAYEAYDPHEWSKKLWDQKLTYCEWEDDHSQFGNCTSCHKVGVTDFYCLCQEEACFVHYICKGALSQENKPASRQIVDPVVWAGLHGQLGVSAYALHLMQPKYYLPLSHLDRKAGWSLRFFQDDDGNFLGDDGDLIDVDLECLLKCLDEGKARETDFKFLSAVVMATSLQGLWPALFEWKHWASFD